VLGFSIWYAGSIDVWMLEDSRHHAEAWLARHAGRDAPVAALGRPEYLPRPRGLHWTFIGPTPDDLERVKPAFVVLNAAYERRYRGNDPRARFRAALDSGELGYGRAFEYRALPWYALLTYVPRMRDTVEDPLTNLDKVNPEIVIYRRRIIGS
jgi:hypothetical protein